MDDILKNYKGEQKLREGIRIFNENPSSLSKGKKTNYCMAASYSVELLEEYIALTNDKLKNKIPRSKSPNVKDFIIFAKEKLYRRFGVSIVLHPTPEQEKLLMLNVDAYRWTYNFLYADKLEKAIKPYRWEKFIAELRHQYDGEELVLPKFPKWDPSYTKDIFYSKR